MERRQIIQKLKAKRDETLRGKPGSDGRDGRDGLDGAKGETGNRGIPGARGIKGERGERGLKGSQGLKGEKGDQGDKGRPGQGIIWRGEWANAIKYNKYDAIISYGSAFICTNVHTSRNRNRPTTGEEWGLYWALLAERGEAGPGGSPGRDGTGDTSNLVPYSGATSDVDLGSKELVSGTVNLGVVLETSMAQIDGVELRPSATGRLTGFSIGTDIFNGMEFFWDNGLGTDPNDPISWQAKFDTFNYANPIYFDASAVNFNVTSGNDTHVGGNLIVDNAPSGSFTTADLKTVTVVNGIITSIV